MAVHCRAGLGRTGTLIGLYIMHKWGFEAKALIAWMRICRAGMVVGEQQQFLESTEHRLPRIMQSAGIAARYGVREDDRTTISASAQKRQNFLYYQTSSDESEEDQFR